MALTVFVVAPLAYPGYMQVHSGLVPAYNMADLASRSFSLSWTPRVATEFDPLRSDGLLAYYLGLPVLLLGGTPVMAVKWVLALAWVLGALGVYLWLRETVGPPGACLAALAYTYAPYHIATVYVRGAWGEALCLALVPFGMATVLRQPTGATQARRQLLLAGSVWFLIGMSQPGLAVLAWLCMILWWLVAAVRLRYPWPVLAAGGGLAAADTCALWAASWHIGTSPVSFSEHYLQPAQLLSPFWGFGASRADWSDGLSFSLGLGLVGLVLLSLLLQVQHPRVMPLVRSHASLSGATPHGIAPREACGEVPVPSGGTPTVRGPLVAAVAMGFLLFAPADLAWRTGLNTLTTYPWQVLGLVALCLATVAGALPALDRRLSTRTIQAALIAFLLLASYSYLQPRFTQIEPGPAPRASWNEYQAMVLDVHTEIEILPAAAGLPQATSGRLPIGPDAALQPGDTLHVLITWQITRPFDRDLKLFVHVLDATGQIVAQADPLAGAGADPSTPGADYPTSRWDPGQLVVTNAPITLPVHAPAGPYRVAFGLYDGQTLDRVPVDGSDAASLTVDVTGAGHSL